MYPRPGAGPPRRRCRSYVRWPPNAAQGTARNTTARPQVAPWGTRLVGGRGWAANWCPRLQPPCAEYPTHPSTYQRYLFHFRHVICRSRRPGARDQSPSGLWVQSVSKPPALGRLVHLGCDFHRGSRLYRLSLSRGLLVRCALDLWPNATLQYPSKGIRHIHTSGEPYLPCVL